MNCIFEKSDEFLNIDVATMYEHQLTYLKIREIYTLDEILLYSEDFILKEIPEIIPPSITTNELILFKSELPEEINEIYSKITYNKTTEIDELVIKFIEEIKGLNKQQNGGDKYKLKYEKYKKKYLALKNIN